MKINFPITYFPHLQFKKQNAQSPIKPLPFDTFERISFAKACEANTAAHNFEIKNIKNLRCPVCGLIMLSDEQINQFVNDIRDKRGYDLVDALEKYEDDSIFTGVEQNPPRSIYREQKQEIVDIIKNLAIQYPKKSLSELVEFEAQKRIGALIQTQLETVKELENYVKSSNASRAEKAQINDIISEFKKEIEGLGENQFSRKRFIYALSNVVSDRTTQGKITEIARKLPTSEQDVNSWFVKYSKPLKSHEIAKKFVQQSVPSAEHLQPRSKDGANSIKNYICDCADCNSKRGNVEFDEWMRTIPNFKEKLQNYLQDVQNAIDKGQISRSYDSYIDNIIETIKKLSNGEIILDVPNSLDGEKRKQVLAKREAKIADISKSLKDLARTRREKQKEIEYLESHPYYQNMLKKQALEKQLQDLENELANTNVDVEADRLQHNISITKRKIRLCESYELKMDNLSGRINSLQSVIYNMNRIQAQLSKVEAQLNQENEFRARKKELMDENEARQLQNSQILQDPDFNPKDYTDYNKYLHQMELLDTSSNMLRRLNSKTTKKNREKEVILSGVEYIKEKIAQYLKLNSVIFFVNEEKIKINNVSIQNIDKKLEDIEHKKGLVEEFNQELRKAGSNKTLEQLQYELDNLIETRETIAKIKQLPELRSEYKSLQETIMYNKEILNFLKERYETMTSEEFTHQINLIY